MMTNLMEQLKVMVVQEEEKQVKKSKFDLLQEAMKNNILNRYAKKTDSIKLLPNVKENIWQNYTETETPEKVTSLNKV